MRLRKTNPHDHVSTATGSRLLVLGPVLLSMILPSTVFTGCTAPRRQWEKTVHNDTCEIDAITQQIDDPGPSHFHNASMSSAPVTALSVSAAEIHYVEVSLDETLAQAMEHSTVLRDIGGMVLRSPGTIKTGYATRLQEMDPRFGMESALSAFDAQLNASATFNNNDKIFNNSFFAGGTNAFQQDLHEYQMELSKRTATGSLLAVRGVTDFDSNNAPANTFTSSWNTWLEGEIRQPLLQGAGLEFNRVAGPGSTPGLYNGILIAKANADINHADFIKSLQDFVSNVENAYWDLYLSYRELDARKKAMERALVEWNNAKNRKAAGTIEIGEEALARQQYYQLKAEVDEALSGRLLQGTQTQNGSSGGTVQMQGGVLTAERRLRLLVGLPAADGQLLRPLDEPTMASIHFDWYSCVNEAVRQRPELRRTLVAVKKREMELLAAQNFLNPRLDAVGRYRFRGFGDDYIAGGNQAGATPSSALGNLATGNQQEWTMGIELTVPIGYRKAHAAVQHAELALARERAIQKEQQREVVSNLSGAVADAVRAFQAVENNLNQYLAATDYLQDLETRRDQNIRDGVDRIIDAQRRQLQSEIQFFRARAEYAVALKNVHYEKGSLLRYKDLRVAGDLSLDESWVEEQPIMDPQPVSDEAVPADAAPDPQQTPTELPPATNEEVLPPPPAASSAATATDPIIPQTAAVTSETQLESSIPDETSDSLPAVDIPRIVEDVPAAKPSNASPTAVQVTPIESPVALPEAESDAAIPEIEALEFTEWKSHTAGSRRDTSLGDVTVAPFFATDADAAGLPQKKSVSVNSAAPVPEESAARSLKTHESRHAAAALRQSMSPLAGFRRPGGVAPRQTMPRRSANAVTANVTGPPSSAIGPMHSVSLSKTVPASEPAKNEIGATTPISSPVQAGADLFPVPPVGAITPIPGMEIEAGPMTPLK